MIIARQSRSSLVRLSTVLAGLLLLAATALVPASSSAQDNITLLFGERDSSKEFDLSSVGSHAKGIWSNGTTMWVAHEHGSTVYAYTLSTGSYDSTKDITVSSDGLKRGLWSDDTTMWLAFRQSETSTPGDNEVEAYTLSTGSYNGTKSFDLDDFDNTEPEGIWSDGTTLWVAENSHVGYRVLAYTLSNGVRDTSKDINLHSHNTDPGGIWSDGTTLWVADGTDGKVYAYTLSSGQRFQAKEFNLDSLHNRSPFGIWSDGTTMWVTDNDDQRVYAYNISGPTNIGGL